MEDTSLPVFTIGIVADIIGVSVQTLRLWENKGLIKPSRKGKDRYYSQDDLKKLKYIKYLLSEKKLNTYGAKELMEKEGWQHFDDGSTPEAPAAQKAEEPAAPETLAPSEPVANTPLTERKRILIIDDDFDQVLTTKTVLESENYEILTALSGRDGLDKAKTDRPDLILLDIMIPDLDGIEICRTLKSNPEFSGIPICILSSIPQNMRDKFGINDSKMAADAFQQKPVRPGILLDQVKKLLG